MKSNAMDKPPTNKGMEVRLWQGPYNCATKRHRKAIGIGDGGIVQLESDKGLVEIEVQRAPGQCVKHINRSEVPVLVLDTETLFSLYVKAGDKIMVKVVKP